MTYFFETYGCQMNKAESSALELELDSRAWTAAASAEEANLVILNTCSVRATAEQRTLGRIAHFAAEKKKHPLTLLVAGCMAERLGDSLKEKGADFVMGTSARSLFPSILQALESGKEWVDTDEQPRFTFSSSHLSKGDFSSFVPIMHGCNNFCSYCIVPYVRGREISRDPASILDEIAMLEAHGVREITLLGQNVNSYQWHDGNRQVDFPMLLDMIASSLKKVKWLRFLSSHPKDFSDAVIDVMASHPVFCRYLHLCVQHGSDAVLKRMNRKYTRAHYLGIIERLRKALPDIGLSTDILVGFPGETEKDIQETLDLMKEVRYANAFMYYFNPREGTAAYTMEDQIPDELKKERLARVIELQLEHSAQRLHERIGVCEPVLVQGPSRRNKEELIARTERDEMIVFTGNSADIGSFIDLEFSSLRGKTFRGKEAIQCPGV